MTTIIIPEDDDSYFPDAEDALTVIVDSILANFTPPGYAHTPGGQPQDYDNLVASGVAMVEIARTGGEADGVWDFPRMNVTVTTPSRDLSWKVMAYLRRKLHHINSIGVPLSDGSTAIVNNVKDSQGPQQPPTGTFATDVTLGFTMQNRLS